MNKNARIRMPCSCNSISLGQSDFIRRRVAFLRDFALCSIHSIKQYKATYIHSCIYYSMNRSLTKTLYHIQTSLSNFKLLSILDPWILRARDEAMMMMMMVLCSGPSLRRTRELLAVVASSHHTKIREYRVCVCVSKYSFSK
jgi:hypothetical protein